MNAQTPLIAELPIIATFKALPVEDQHRALQLLIREFGYAQDGFAGALSDAAYELHPNCENRQDDLYPVGALTPAAWQQHYRDAEASVAHALAWIERQAVDVSLARVGRGVAA